MSIIIHLENPLATDLATTGGKGANLARLAQAGFPMPPGFVITTAAYRAHIRAHGLQQRIDDTLAQLDFGRPEAVEAATRQIRDAIVEAPLGPELVQAVRDAYRALGGHVAVRSSGTAEDLAGASFAGQHDTYLDVIGEEEVLLAVRRCWASLWTARATAYRQQRGFDHAEVSLAVVILTMVESVASGVLFTANPLTGAVDESLVNSAWGLGEGIVSGKVTPDAFTLDRASGRVKKRELGAKALRFERDPFSGKGVAEVPVPATERERYSLTDSQLAELWQLGRRVTEYFEGFPQDIEWAWAEGRFYLLQSRDITGVEFCWDEDIDEHGALPRLEDDALLSRARTDQVWTGRITPLFYSLRSEARVRANPRTFAVWAGDEAAQRRWGGGGLPVGQLRWYKYHRGAVFFNSEVQFRTQLESVPPAVRNAGVCDWTPPSWLLDFNERPGSWWNMPRILWRIARHNRERMPLGIYDHLQKLVDHGRAGLGRPLAEIRAMSDAELKAYVDHTIQVQSDWVFEIVNCFNLYAPYMSSMLEWMLERWYPGHDPKAIATRFVTGLEVQTYTIKQNAGLWDLTERIRGSALLTDLFNRHPGAAFFTELEQHEEGREFLRHYEAFLQDFGHRGQADRDIWYPRRWEDPAIDYRAFAMLMQVEHHDQARMEERLIAEREALTAEVLAHVRRQPWGWLKARLLRRFQKLLLRYYAFRDDSRHQTDRHTWGKKCAVLEVGRRLQERGVLTGPDEFYYLTKNELVGLLDGDLSQLRLMKAKAAARRRNCERYRKEWFPPMYLRGDGTVWEDPTETADTLTADGAFRGISMSGGTITAIARVVPSIEELGRVQKGEILVTRATDPGWTPVFMVLSGLVLETGGALSHGSCLAREYAIPAVQLPDAMSKLKDGARISVNGTTGEVRVLDDGPASGDGVAAVKPEEQALP